MHDEPRNELEQRALDAWTVREPPPDFVDRVMQAAAREPSFAHRGSPALGLPTPRPRWPRFAAAAIVAVALAGGLTAGIKFWPTTPATPRSEQHQPSMHGPGEPDHGAETVPLTPPASKPIVADVPADLAAQVDRYIASYGQHYGDAFKFQGSVLVLRRGQLLYSGNFGRADITSGPPITADTRFKIGSLTQQFTALAILQLSQAGKLALTDPVQKHIPGFPHASVTIRHLLSHSSGIQNYTDRLTTTFTRGTAYATQIVVDSFKDLPLEFTPGSQFGPSNSNYFLLGAIVEATTGMPYAQYLEENVFHPAGMTHTTLGLPPAATVATGYTFSEDELLIPALPFDLSVYGGASGIVSTPSDLAQWDSALRESGQLLSQRSLEEMFTAVTESYGLGWVVVKEHGQTMVGHPGGVEGFNGAIARYLDDGITVIALANTEAIDCRSVLDAVSTIAHGEAAPPFAEHVEVPVPADSAARYLGTYRLTPASRLKLGTMLDRDDLAAMEEVKIYDDHDRLFMLVPSHGAKWLHGSGDDRFFFKDMAGTTAQFGPPGAPVQWLRLWKEDLEFELSKTAGPPASSPRQ